MWCLALSLLVVPGEVRSEIKDDEVVVFYPTYAYQVGGGRALNVPIHGSIFEPETGSFKRSVAAAGLGPAAARFATAFEGVPEDRWKVFTGPEELEDIVPPGLLQR